MISAPPNPVAPYAETPTTRGPAPGALGGRPDHAGRSRRRPMGNRRAPYGPVRLGISAHVPGAKIGRRGLGSVADEDWGRGSEDPRRSGAAEPAAEEPGRAIRRRGIRGTLG